MRKIKEVNPHKNNSNASNATHIGSIALNVAAFTSQTMHSTSFNRIRPNISLWSEIDCGVFYRQSKNWPACSKWIDETQLALDDVARGFDFFHYPNVPNLATEEWGNAYYSPETYNRLLQEKIKWDPKNFFRHIQSIGKEHYITDRDLIQEKKTMMFAKLCRGAYTWNALRDLRLLSVVIGGVLSFGSIIKHFSSKRIFQRLISFFLSIHDRIES